ncbi:MAG: hypothetical protein LBO72_08320 [Helicobacteraceae bacterium]|nr:hypothetical protein [Helicobacteraceae bacterium]
MSQDETPKAPQNRREEIAGAAVLVALIIGAIAYFVGYKNANESIRPIVAAGAFHSLALTSEGKVYATGSGEYGQLGLGDDADRNVWTLVSSLEGKSVTRIASTWSHSIALDSEGKVYATGENDYGQLGLGDEIHRDAFTLAQSLEGKKIVAITTSGSHSFALDGEGKIYAAGDNDYGRLGLGDSGEETNHKTFTLVPAFSNKKIVAIAYFFAIDADGKVYATGFNYDGELGLGDTINRNIFTPISSLSDKNITEIASSGFGYTLALDVSGEVYATGNNEFGQLGLGDKKNRDTFTPVSSLKDKKIIAIAAGRSHSLALDAYGRLYAAGYNYENRLGFDDNANNLFTLIPPFADKKIVAITTNHAHSLAIDSEGKFYATGCNENGQLGLGDNVNRKTWTLVSDTTSSADAINLAEGKCNLLDYLGFGDRYDREKFAFAPLLNR